jgi:hypothetical protein
MAHSVLPLRRVGRPAPVEPPQGGNTARIRWLSGVLDVFLFLVG